MIDWGNTTVLVVAPHPDDEVIGAGGLISKVKAAGGAAHVLYLTVGQTQDFTEHGTTTINERVSEIERVAAHLGLDSWRIVFEGDEYHLQLDQVPQREIIHEIERGEDLSLETLQPDVIVMPPATDYNQDHRAAAWAGMAACRPAPREDKFVPTLILQAEAPMSVWTPTPSASQPNLIVELSDEELEKKIVGMELYVTQVRRPGHTRNSETLRALAQLRGSLIGCLYAEAFHAHKVVT